jgi:mannose-6-phosphate isomerase-like protein (cupin superfamily)
MQIVRLNDAKPYEAKLHWDMSAIRLQGIEASQLKNFSCSLSYFLPGGGANWSSSANEKVYVVLDGEATILTKQDGQEVITVLGKLDSCVIDYNEERAVENRTNQVVTMLVIVSNS